MENEELLHKKKERIAQLPNYRGEVMSRNAIRQLPSVEPGQIFWVAMDEKPYVIAEKEGRKITLKALDETATISTGITIYELNKSMVEKEPVFDWNNQDIVSNLDGKLQEWFYETTKDTFYLFYGRDIHYVTLVKKTGKDANLLENIKEMVEEFGELVSIDIDTDDNGEEKLEIWVRTEFSKAELLYFFPYDAALVEI